MSEWFPEADTNIRCHLIYKQYVSVKRKIKYYFLNKYTKSTGFLYDKKNIPSSYRTQNLSFSYTVEK